jgi:hypothetical protein
MKKKNTAPNAEPRTLIIEWLGEARVKEEPSLYFASNEDDSTPNAQRPTLNAQRQNQPHFNLEDRLLEFSARIIRLVDALPNTGAGQSPCWAAPSLWDFALWQPPRSRSCGITQGFYSQVKGLPEGAERNSTLVTARRQIRNAPGFENGCDPSWD